MAEWTERTFGLLSATASAVRTLLWPITPDTRQVINYAIVLVLPIALALSLLSAWISWRFFPDVLAGSYDWQSEVYMFVYAGMGRIATGFYLLGMAALIVLFHVKGERHDARPATDRLWPDLALCTGVLLCIQVAVGAALTTRYGGDHWQWDNGMDDTRIVHLKLLKDNLLHAFLNLVPVALVLFLFARQYRLPWAGWKRTGPVLFATAIGLFLTDAMLWATYDLVSNTVLLLLKVIFQGSLITIAFGYVVIMAFALFTVPVAMAALWTPFKEGLLDVARGAEHISSTDGSEHGNTGNE